MNLERLYQERVCPFVATSSTSHYGPTLSS